MFSTQNGQLFYIFITKCTESRELCRKETARSNKLISIFDILLTRFQYNSRPTERLFGMLSFCHLFHFSSFTFSIISVKFLTLKKKQRDREHQRRLLWYIWYSHDVITEIHELFFIHIEFLAFNIIKLRGFYLSMWPLEMLYNLNFGDMQKVQYTFSTISGIILKRVL